MSQDHTTLCGLNHWFTHMFEKAGWMILAINRKDEQGKAKVESYLQSLQKLQVDLESRAQNSRGNGTIQKDFVVMALDVKELHEQITEFKNMELKEENLSETSDLVAKDATLHGLHKWFEYKIEKFGWMILVNNKLNREGTEGSYHQHLVKKLDLYKEGLELLAQSLHNRESESNDIDKDNVQHDLHVMESHVKVLLNAFNNKKGSSPSLLNIGNLIGGANKYINMKRSQKKSKK
jgi:hypothetical protein